MIADGTHLHIEPHLMHHQALLGADFWTLIGGEGTFEELLAIYREAGQAKRKNMMDALAFGF